MQLCCLHEAAKSSQVARPILRGSVYPIGSLLALIKLSIINQIMRILGVQKLRFESQRFEGRVTQNLPHRCNNFITLVPIGANNQQEEQISVSPFQKTRHFAHFLKQRRLQLHYIKAIQSGTYGAWAKKRRVRLGEERLNIERAAFKKFSKKFVSKLLTRGQTWHII
ncbi:MAG TPA: hypothetical protein IAB15_04700 [Candidatus Ornithoclostridium faecigallinarum]|nr:hypothetical protein [Candidatus Ornithoclostridium faecigallinarum]